LYIAKPGSKSSIQSNVNRGFDCGLREPRHRTPADESIATTEDGPREARVAREALCILQPYSLSPVQNNEWNTVSGIRVIL
jgi:hypothetical protein